MDENKPREIYFMSVSFEIPCKILKMEIEMRVVAFHLRFPPLSGFSSLNNNEKKEIREKFLKKNEKREKVIILK